MDNNQGRKGFIGSVARVASSFLSQIRGDVAEDNDEDNDKGDTEGNDNERNEEYKDRGNDVESVDGGDISLNSNNEKIRKLDTVIRSELKGLYPDKEFNEIKARWIAIMKGLDSDGEESGGNEEDGDHDEDDNSTYPQRDVVNERRSRSSTKRSRAVAANEAPIPGDEDTRAAKRQRLDSVIISEPKNIYPNKQPREIEETWKGIMEAVNRETRTIFLMNFRHDVPGSKASIIAKIVPKLPSNSTTYKNMESIIRTKIGQMRHKTPLTLQAHVKTAIQKASQDFQDFQDCVSMRELTQHFERLYSHENFFEASTFADSYLDIPRSSPLARYYIKTIYTHFCARAKLLNDHESGPEPEAESPHTKAELIKYMQRFHMLPIFARLEREQFHQLPGKRTTKRAEKPVEECDLVRGVDYFLGRPPPPPPRRQGLEQRSGFGRGQGPILQPEWAPWSVESLRVDSFLGSGLDVELRSASGWLRRCLRSGSLDRCIFRLCVGFATWSSDMERWLASDG